MTRQFKKDTLKRDNFKFTAETILHYPFHINKNLRVLYVIEGSIQINYVSGSTVLKENDIECINSREPAEIKALTTSNVVIILEININFLQQINPNIRKMILNINAVQFFPTSRRHDTKENIQNTEKLKKLYINLLKNYIYEFKSQATSHNLENISQFLIEHFDDVRKHLKCFAYNDPHIIDRFHKIDYYIQENISKKIQLEHLVDLVFLSPQYISAEIKEKYCRTFLSIIEYYRTVEAVRLILNNHSIKSYEIIHRCGFSNSRYFYRAFKKHMACTPEAFKDKLDHNGKAFFTKVLNIDSPAIIHHLTYLPSSNETSLTYGSSYGDINWREVAKGYYMSNVKHVNSFNQIYTLFTSVDKLRIEIFHDEIWLYHGGDPLLINILKNSEVMNQPSYVKLADKQKGNKTPTLALKKGDIIHVKHENISQRTFISRMFK